MTINKTVIKVLICVDIIKMIIYFIPQDVLRYQNKFFKHVIVGNILITYGR